MNDIVKSISDLPNINSILIFVCIGLGGLLSRIKIFGFSFGATFNTLLVALVFSSMGFTINAFLKYFMFSMFLFATGYQCGDKLPLVFSRHSIKHILLSIIMAFFSLLTVILIYKLFNPSFGILVGVVAGSLTQTSIIEIALDSASGLSSNIMANANMQIYESFSIAYAVGVLVIIVWSGYLIELFYGKSFLSEKRSSSFKLDTVIVNKKFPIVTISFGVAMGVVIGWIKFQAFGVTIAIGSIGSLLVGLAIGYFDSCISKKTVNENVINFVQELGLLCFIASVGLSVGKGFYSVVEQNGAYVIMLAFIMSIIPLFITTILGRFILKYDNVSVFSGAIAGARVSGPASALIFQKTGSSQHLQGFAVSYVVSSILLSFIAPIIVLLFH
ncbi:MAG: hypothetical protein PHC75_07270 [Burkholderiales bacterium]|nr:hypothetical protein [Burkholderiales bacterium]